LGLRSENFVFVDYFPLLPWFGVVLLGLGIGNILHSHHSRRVKLPELGRFPLFRPLCAMGRNSLLIYVVHQPVLILILMLIVIGIQS